EPLIERLIPLGLPCLIVDDGGDARMKEILSRVASQQAGITVIYSEKNAGKGAAVKRGFHFAQDNGFTHALQLDADLQHARADIPRFIAAAKDNARALVLGRPIFGKDAPWMRRLGRYLTHAMVWLETRSFDIRDALCGYRVYPLMSTCEVIRDAAIGDRMDFD